MSLLNLKWQQGEDRAFVYALDPTESGNIFYLQVQPDYVNGKRTTPEQLAEVGNAVAALPDLLAALEAGYSDLRTRLIHYAQSAFGASYENAVKYTDTGVPVLEQMRAAIAKVKGEANG